MKRLFATFARIQIVLFLMVISSFPFSQKAVAVLRCSAIYHSANNSVSVNSSVFQNGIFHVDSLSATASGTEYLNPVRMKWEFDGEGKIFRPKVFNLATPEPSILFSGILDFKKSDVPFRFYAEEGLPTERPVSLGGSLPGVSGRLDASSEAGTSSGIRIKVSSSDPGVVIQLTMNLGSEGVMTHQFRAPDVSTEIYIPWSQFERIGEGDRPPYSAVSNQFVFEVVKSHQTKAKLKQQSIDPFSFKIDGPLVFERDIIGDPRIAKYLMEVDYRVGVSDFDKRVGIPKDGSTKEGNRLMIKKVIDNLYNPKHQQYALDIAAQGIDAVRKKAKELGFGFFFVKGKFDIGDFFVDSKMNYIEPDKFTDEPSPYMKTGRHTPLIPIETGSFALEHGSYSHTLQIIAVTHGMTQAEKAHFVSIYGSFFTSEPARWIAWDTLFDAPGIRGPNSPLWWRDRAGLDKPKTRKN